MLYNRPPSGPAQTPGFTTAPTNRQTIPAFGASGEPALQTAPSSVTPNPLAQNSSTSAPSSSNFATSNAPASNNMMGNSPLGGTPGNMLSTHPPNLSPAPSSNEAPSMASYFNSSNPSTLMRATVGNTTQSGAA